MQDVTGKLRLFTNLKKKIQRECKGSFLSFFLYKFKMTHQVFPSILDNDLYKFTMQNAVFTYYKRDIPVVYQFTNREKQLQLNAEAVDWLQKQIDGKLRL